MKRFGWVLVVLVLASPASAAKRMTVEQLEQMLDAAQGKPDAELARHLSDLELTERLSSVRLAHWQATLPDDQARQALIALADQSQFLDPPASEIPSTAAPDFVAQQQIMSLVVRYVKTAIPQLPNIFANQQTAYYQEFPKSYEGASQISTSFQPLHFLRNSIATVRYSNGRELVEEEAVEGKKTTLSEAPLKAHGIFGPILGIVLEDAARNKLAWGRWEEGSSGTLAVFNYAVPKEKSHYGLDYCCVANSYGTSQRFHQLTGYHGQVAVDPATGSILRLTLEAELKASDPVSQAAIMVEYGPVEIGGKNYICPLKSLSLSRAQTMKTVSDVPLATAPPGVRGSIRSTTSVTSLTSVVPGPQRTLLNDAVYSSYHIFRSESRILTGNEAADASAPAPAIPANLAANKPEAATANAVAAVNASPTPAVTPAAPTTEAAPAPPSAPASDEEIREEEAKGLPETSAIAGQALASGFTIQTVSRLVDIGLVAYDKKDHPIRDLKQEDFEVYDNGRKQEVRFFSQTVEEAPSALAGSPAGTAEQISAAPVQPIFSNRGAGGALKENAKLESSATILLIDSSNLSFSDIGYSRAETLRFLRVLPAGERVGLYVLKSHGFQILAEETTDHALLEEKLSRWMPSAGDLARAQDEERRNRQQFETVHSMDDLLYVNGNTGNDPEGHSQTLDPQLRDWGSNPAGNAMMIMVGVARHLAAIPGHKNLVWISSDNALVDWSNKAVSIEKGDKYIEPNTLHAQEAMNDAHVSVYPLDVSQLEGGMTDASIGRRSVELAEVTPMRTQQSSLGPEAGSGKDINTQNNGGHTLGSTRLAAQMQQDMRPIQGPVRHLADATGGRVFRRSGGISGELNGVVEDGHAAYQLGFYPDSPADGKFHTISVKISGKRKDAVLRYRTGYLYAKEPATLKERFQQAIWLPTDANQLAVRVQPMAREDGLHVKIDLAAGDLALEEKSGRWNDKLDIFLVQRDDAELHAQVEGKTVGLQLKDATLQEVRANGLSFERTVQLKPSINSLRILVVDENSGRMGSVTIPTASLPAAH
jgi:VWFA-related protein